MDLRVDAELIALLDVVIEHGGQQVVGSTDGMEVAGEVQVDVLHRHDLGIAAASSSALDAKDGPQGGLAQRDDHVLADLAQAIGQTHRRGGLALARRRRRDGRHEDELAVRLVGVVLSTEMLSTLAMYLPWGSRYFSSMPACAATSTMGSISQACAISMSDGMPPFSSSRPVLRRRSRVFLSVAHVGDATDILHR